MAFKRLQILVKFFIWCTRFNSIQFKITTTYQELLIETKPQDRHNIYPRKPSRGRKPSKNFLYIRCIKDNPKNSCSPPFVLSLSLSYALHKWVSLCLNKNHNSSIYTRVNLTFALDKSAPINCLGRLLLGILKNSILYYLLWY